MELEILSKLQSDLLAVAAIQKENEYLKAGKKMMSKQLLELMSEKYESQTYEERCAIFKDHCRDCRKRDWCGIKLPEDIMKPMPSEKDWIPATKSCGEFEWS